MHRHMHTWQHLHWKLVAGASAATVAHVLTYPMDTIRRRMQVCGNVGRKAGRTVVKTRAGLV